MLAFAGPGSEVVRTGVKAGLGVVESGLLGAFAVMCLVVSGVCVWQLIRVQNKRVADQKQLNDHMERAREKMEGLIEKMTEAFSGHRAALDRLTEAEKAQTETLRDLASKFEGVRTTMDSVIRDAVRNPYKRSYTPTSTSKPPPRGDRP